MPFSLLVVFLGASYAVTPLTAFVAYPFLAKAGYSSPGGVDIDYSTLGLGLINPNDEAIFELDSLETAPPLAANAPFSAT